MHDFPAPSTEVATATRNGAGSLEKGCSADERCGRPKESRGVARIGTHARGHSGHARAEHLCQLMRADRAKWGVESFHQAVLSRAPYSGLAVPCALEPARGHGAAIDQLLPPIWKPRGARRGVWGVGGAQIASGGLVVVLVGQLKEGVPELVDDRWRGYQGSSSAGCSGFPCRARRGPPYSVVFTRTTMMCAFVKRTAPVTSLKVAPGRLRDEITRRPEPLAAPNCAMNAVVRGVVFAGS